MIWPLLCDYSQFNTQNRTICQSVFRAENWISIIEMLDERIQMNTNTYKYTQIYTNCILFMCVPHMCYIHSHTHTYAYMYRPPCRWRFLLELLVALVAHIVKPPSIPLMPVLPPFLAAVVRHLFCSVNTYSCIHTFSHTFAHTNTHRHTWANNLGNEVSGSEDAPSTLSPLKWIREMYNKQKQMAHHFFRWKSEIKKRKTLEK